MFLEERAPKVSDHTGYITIMSRRRFFVNQVRNGQAELEGDEARHLTHVLRVEAGQRYEISDNRRVYLAEVDLARKQHVVFRVIEALPDVEPASPVTLLVALIKFDRLELLLEKATELGVGTIRFVKAERSEKGLEQGAQKRLTRWRRIVQESSEQSRRAHLPELIPPVSFKEALKVEAEHRLFLDEQRDGLSLLDALPVLERAQQVAVMAGPEGGWPDHERDAARQAGWTGVSLGPQVLRTETGAIAALAVINAVLQRTVLQRQLDSYS
jgi:16S rRNA (uracil1498-N3)-methyltransferase